MKQPDETKKHRLSGRPDQMVRRQSLTEPFPLALVILTFPRVWGSRDSLEAAFWHS